MDIAYILAFKTQPPSHNTYLAKSSMLLASYVFRLEYL